GRAGAGGRGQPGGEVGVPGPVHVEVRRVQGLARETGWLVADGPRGTGVPGGDRGAVELVPGDALARPRQQGVVRDGGAVAEGEPRGHGTGGRDRGRHGGPVDGGAEVQQARALRDRGHAPGDGGPHGGEHVRVRTEG